MYRTPDNELKQIAEIELHENSKLIAHDLWHIREWMTKQPHLGFVIDDQFLLTFLRCSKFSLERAKVAIDNYYTIRTLVPELFSERDPFLPEIQLILNAGALLPLPKCYENRRIVFYNYSNKLNPNTMSFNNILKVMYMIMDIVFREDDNAVIAGIINWSNGSGFSPKYIKQITPSCIKNLSAITKTHPFRVKGIYVTNAPEVFKYIYDLFQLLLPKKITERLVLYSESNTNEFYNKIPQELLPEEYGGKNGTVKDLTIEWKKKCESYRDRFLEDDKLKTNESLRQGTAITSLNEFGMEGSFRQLNID